MSKLVEVKNDIKKWNKEVFGDVRLEKIAVLSKIGELDALEASGNMGESDRRQRGELRKRLEELILKEETSWYQKTRLKGIIEWDNNLKLFHRIASGRKVNKMINKIENTNGEVVVEEKEIVEEITTFFEMLYSLEREVDLGVEGLERAEISEEKRIRLEQPFEEEEVRRALFDCEGDKAPGPDGFTMAALQEGWEVIKEDLMKFFREFF